MESKANWIRLTQEKWVEVDKVDLVWLTRYRWYAKRTTAKSEGNGKYYAARFQRVNGVGKTIYMHREIMDCPQGMEVDHKNRDSLCNRRENMKICSRQEHNRSRFYS